MDVWKLFLVKLCGRQKDSSTNLLMYILTSPLMVEMTWLDGWVGLATA